MAVLTWICAHYRLIIFRESFLFTKFVENFVRFFYMTAVLSWRNSFKNFDEMVQVVLCQINYIFCHNYPKLQRMIFALSFYVTKTVLVCPKWFWSDQIDLDLTIMIWSRPKWNGHDQNELVRSKLWFSTKMNHNLDLTNSFWSWPFHYGYDQIIMVKSKSIWSDQNHFGPTKTVLVT